MYTLRTVSFEYLGFFYSNFVSGNRTISIFNNRKYLTKANVCSLKKKIYLKDYSKIKKETLSSSSIFFKNVFNLFFVYKRWLYKQKEWLGYKFILS